ncbi:MAG: LytTR family DNA-binding domain-containing protein [Saprospiraceae bacterium]|nr:LytTR family DNA-binding domain-containing protein [Saprospiraceae bacterium]
MLKAYLVDDEKNCTDILSLQIKEHCPELTVACVFNDPVKALAAIQSAAPDVLFLDIEMPGLSGFELLEQCEGLEAEIIFTTAYDSYAIQAIRFSALDYLLKPVRAEELRSAVSRLMEKKDDQSLQMQLDLLLHQIQQPAQRLEKIALSTSDGLEIADVKDILFCEAQSNYTMFHFVGNKKLLVSKPLKQMEELLKDHPFFRVHQSYLVNLQYIKKYVRSDGGYVILEGNAMVNVAQSRKEGLVRRLQNL